MNEPTFNGKVESVEDKENRIIVKISGKTYSIWNDEKHAAAIEQLNEICTNAQEAGEDPFIAGTHTEKPGQGSNVYRNIHALWPIHPEELNVQLTAPAAQQSKTKTYSFGAKPAAAAPRSAPPASKFSQDAKNGYWDQRAENDVKNGVRIGRQSNWNTAVEVTKILVQTEAIPDSKTLESIFKKGNDTENLVEFIKDLAHDIETDVTREQ